MYNVKPSYSDMDLILNHHYGMGILASKKGPVDMPAVADHTWRTVACFALALSLYLIPEDGPHWPGSRFWNFVRLVVVIVLPCLLLHKLGKFADQCVRLGLREDDPVKKRKTALFLLWWPFWTLFLALLGAALGMFLGQYLWHGNLKWYYELEKLQSYRNIDPLMVPGSRLQDSGVVEFVKGTGIDRSAGGCFVTSGHTYCVAPILKGGEVMAAMADLPMSGSYDYFAVGVDCCVCPNQDFRCGADWASTTARGGLRNTDDVALAFYNMAADDWAAAYQKVVHKPLFFTWVESEKRSLAKLLDWPLSVAFLACCFFVTFALVVALFLSKILKLLLQWEIAQTDRPERFRTHDPVPMPGQPSMNMMIDGRDRGPSESGPGYGAVEYHGDQPIHTHTDGRRII